MRKIIKKRDTIVFSERQLKLIAATKSIPAENRIIIEMLSRTSVFSSSIQPIPRDVNDPLYASAILQFNNFYSSVLKFIKQIEGVTIVNKSESQSWGSVSRYVRFTIDDELTGEVVPFMLELRTSDHLLPEDWEEFSESRLQGIIDEYEKRTGNHLTAFPFEFIVNHHRFDSYNRALEAVRETILDKIDEVSELSDL
jgi:hypothetical protein